MIGVFVGNPEEKIFKKAPEKSIEREAKAVRTLFGERGSSKPLH